MKKLLHSILVLCTMMCVACEPTVNFSLSPNSLQMKVGDITTINVIGQATNIEWASSNEDVATVFHGAVTAKAIGTTTITAKSGEIVVNAQVFVSGTDGATLRISPAFVAMKKGETHQFQYGNTYGLDITWSSSAEDIVKEAEMLRDFVGGNFYIKIFTVLIDSPAVTDWCICELVLIHIIEDTH